MYIIIILIFIILISKDKSTDFKSMMQMNGH